MKRKNATIQNEKPDAKQMISIINLGEKSIIYLENHVTFGASLSFFSARTHARTDTPAHSTCHLLDAMIDRFTNQLDVSTEAAASRARTCRWRSSSSCRSPTWLAVVDSMDDADDSACNRKSNAITE